MNNRRGKRLPLYFSHHYFNHNICEVWRIVSDMSLVPIFGEQASLKRYYPQLNLSFNGESRLNITLDKSLKVFYQIEAQTVTDYFCSLKWKGYLSSSRQELFESVCTLHYESPDKTLFFITYSFPYEYDQFVQEECHRQAYYNSVDTFLFSKEHLKIHNFIRVIKGDIFTGINCLLNFMSCLDLVFDSINGNQPKAKIGMVVTSNLNKAHIINDKMDIISKLIKIEKTRTSFLIVSYAYDKGNHLPYRCCYLEVFSEAKDEDQCNGDGHQADACKEKSFVMSFRHIFNSELDKTQLGYTQHYKNLFVTKFEKIVQKIDKRKVIKSIS